MHERRGPWEMTLVYLVVITDFVSCWPTDSEALRGWAAGQYSKPVSMWNNSPIPAMFVMPPCHGIVLEDASIDDLQQFMAQGRLTSFQITQCYIDRSNQLADTVNAVLELNPNALAIAQNLDDERAAGQVRGALHGIPFLIKDNIASKDKMQTTAGSLALVGSIVPRDAFVVSRLREAGAVLMGKATLSEWADMRSSDYSEGYSARGGQARSSYNFTVNPGGSSTGSATAVANNIVPFALGTETDGSLINPAERNAIVGIKPTVGLTSRAGVIPESLNQDTVGVFGKTVHDAVYALDNIYGADARDAASASQAGNTPAEGYVHSMADEKALQGARFGLPWASFWALADPEQQSILLQLIHLIEQAGATIVNGTEIPNYDRLVSPDGWDWDCGTKRGFRNESEFSYVKVDFYNNIATYLASLENTRMRSLEDIVTFNIANTEAEGGLPGTNPAFASGQDLFLESLATKGIMNDTYHQALRFCRSATGENGIDAALSSAHLDALIVPPDVAQSIQIAAQAGYPVITLPAYVHSLSGMPFGIALVGTAWSEEGLIRWASAIEDLQRASETKYRRTKPTWPGWESHVIPVTPQCAGS